MLNFLTKTGKKFFSLFSGHSSQMRLALFIGAGLILPIYNAMGQVQGVGSIIEGVLTNIGSGVTNVIVGGFLLILNFIVMLIALALAQILPPIAQTLDWVISRTFNTGPAGAGLFIDAPFVVTGWVILRDFANMFFIFILLVAAIATILNIRGYDIKALLPRLVGVALLINFSRVIAGVIIDISQAVMLYFTQFGIVSQGKQVGLALALTKGIGINKLVTVPLLDNLNTTYTNLRKLFTDTSFTAQQMTEIAANIFVVIFLFFTIVVFAWLAVMLIYRIVMLWHLIILSPIAWASAVLPFSRQMWSSWWKNFLKWNFFGIAVGFYLFVSALLLQALNSSGWGERFGKDSLLGETGGVYGTGGAAVYGPLSEFISSGSSILVYATIMTFLLTALGVARKQSAFGANVIVDKFPKYAFGKAKGLSMAPFRAAGRGAAGYTSRALERAAKGRLGRVPVLGGALKRTSGRLGEYARKKHGKVDESLIKYHMGRSQADVVRDAKAGDIGAMVVAAKRGWVGSRALFDDDKAKEIHDTLEARGYTDEAGKIADKRPEVAGVTAPVINYFGFGAAHAHNITLAPGASTTLHWSVDNAISVDISVSGFAKDAGEDDDKNVPATDAALPAAKTIRHPGNLGNDTPRNGWFTLVARSGGGSAKQRITITYEPS